MRFFIKTLSQYTGFQSIIVYNRYHVKKHENKQTKIVNRNFRAFLHNIKRKIYKSVY